MLAESSARSARQNILYLELLQSWGMEQARQLAAANEEFSADTLPAELIRPSGHRKPGGGNDPQAGRY